MQYEQNIHRQIRDTEAGPRTPLAGVVRDGFNLTGTGSGRGAASRGATTVIRIRGLEPRAGGRDYS